MLNGTKLSLEKGVLNPSLATLTYTAKTGVFKGSFKLYYEGDGTKGKSQRKTASVSYTGIMVPDSGEMRGLGTGTVTVNKEKYRIGVCLEK